MMKKIYYKTIYKDDNERLLSGGIWDKEAIVEYKRNRWAKTHDWLTKKGYHLCIFDNLDNLKKNVHKYALKKYIQVYECEIKEIIPNLPPMRAHGFLRPDDFRLSSNLWPEGTVMAKQVKIIGKPMNPFGQMG
jgi:hypothetical protein